jgi:hypothetical protein
MPIQSFSLSDIIPNLISGLITYIPDVYNETFGLSGMANEAAPQIEPKIRVMGKVYKRFVAGDIPEASEATQIKDTKFTDEMFTAPEYGKAFAITSNDLIKNQDYQVNFKTMTIARDQAPRLIERVRNASDECVNMIKRAADMQVKQMLETGTLTFSNYETIDFNRDASNSATITTANRKWTLANAATMKPLKDINDWTNQVAVRGNSGGAEFIVLMESATTYNAFASCDEFKADSDVRRNYKIERREGMSADMNKNIPAGALYRYTLIDNAAGPAHIFTYDQRYDYDANTQRTWLDANKVYIIATDNVIQRQPVEILTMNDLIAQSAMMRNVLAATPTMRGWLIQPEWNKITNRALVMGVYRKFLTQMLTPNKTFCAITNS